MKGQIIRFFPVLFILINVLTICSMIIPVEKYNEEESTGFMTDILRGMNFPKTSTNEYRKINRLVSDPIESDPQISEVSLNSKIGGTYSRSDWVDTRWKFRKNVTIDYSQVPADLINFPIYLELFDSDLQNDAQTSGQDIFFTDENGIVLDHEVEEYYRVYNSSHAKLVAWVKTNVSSTFPGTTISMYYGNPSSPSYENPTGVWDENYEFVLHMNQDPAVSDISDSTQNGFDFDVEATSDMNSDDLVSGKLGKAISFDGSNDYIYIPLSENFQGPIDKMTFEFWIYFPNGGPTDREYLAAPGTSSYDPRLSFADNFDFRVENTSISELSSTQSSFSDSTWFHIVAIWDGTGAGLHQIYINGFLNSEDSTPMTGQHIIWDTFAIGAQDDYTNGIGGDNPHNEMYAVIEEFRLSNSVRDSDYIQTVFVNQENPSSFISVNSEETSPESDDWLLPLYGYRKNIQINSTQISGTYHNYPLLIDVTDTDLTDPSKVQIDGDDIAFASNKGWVWSDELIINGGFETGSTIPWSVSGNWQVGTDPPMGDKGPQSGSYCAYVSISGQSTDYIQQDINVNSYASYIDSGKAIANISGWLVAAEDGSDYCNITVQYLDVVKGLISTPFSEGDLLPNAWTEYSLISDLIPINTRYIRIRASCYEDGWDAGSVDSFSVKIGTYQTISQGLKLAHELSDFNRTTGHLTAWVNIPRISDDSDINITLYYGNDALRSNVKPTEVWDDEYEAVWHLEETSGSGSYIIDSTTNGYDGTPTGTQFLQSGVIGGAREFTGSGDNDISMDGGSALLNGWEEFTFSFWIYPNYATDQEWVDDSSPAVFYKAQSAWLARIWSIGSGKGRFQVDLDFFSSGKSYSNVEIYRQKWNWIVYSFDGRYLRTFVNGTLQYTSDLGYDRLVDDSSQFSIGRYSNTFKGYIDEFQILDYGKSVDDVSLEFMGFNKSSQLISVGEEESSDCWWADATFTHRRDIIIDQNNVNSQLENFPVLIDLSTTSLKSGRVQSDGFDIIFMDEYQNKLDHEIDCFEQSISQGRITAWVKVPMVYQSEDTVISMYYESAITLESQENPEAIWQSTAGVWHLSEDPSDPTPQFDDSSINSNDGSASSLSSSNQVSGIIDGSLEFDDSNERHVEVSHSTSLQLSSDMSVYAWIKTIDSDIDVGVIVAKWGSLSADRNYWIGKIDSSTIAFYVDDSQFVTANLNLINNDIWHLVTGVADSVNGELRIYVDGILRNTASYDGTSTTGSSDLHVGNSPGEISQEWNGLIDEVRISGIAYTTGWILTSYTNQMNPTNFISVSNEREFDNIPPTLQDFGIEDLGTGAGTFWAYTSDNLAGVASVTIKINETEFPMSDNGTHWVYEKAVDYLGYYEYQIANASDSVGNYLSNPSSVKNCTFTNDVIAPDVVSRDYINAEGRFYANVTDSWGTIDTVLINVTYHSETLPNPSVAVMVNYSDFGNNIFGYLNDTIDMITGDISFTIIANDTYGNSYTSSPKDSYVFKNTPPVVGGVTLSTAPYYSNTILELTYNFTDAEGHAEDGTEIRWYKNNGSGFLLQAARNDSYSIPALDLFKDDEWYVSVRPRDGQDFGNPVNAITITIVNTPPTVDFIQINPSSAYTTSSLSLQNTTSDYDGDQIIDYYIEWFVNTIHDPAFDNQNIIYPSDTTKGESWECRIRVYDGSDNSSWATSNVVLILNSVPQAVNLSISPTLLYNTSTLVANWDISDSDGDSENKSLAIIYWYKYGIPQPQLTNSSFVNSGNTSKNELWSFKVRIWDGTNYSSLAEISSPVEILNSAPLVDNVQIMISSPKANDDLTTGWQYNDDDNDSEANPTIIWYLDNVSVPEYDNYETLPSSALTKGDYWHFGISVFDGEDFSNQVNSTQVLIENTIPYLELLSLTDDATTLDSLVASWNAVDNDGRDSLEFNITFYLNGIKNYSWITPNETAFLNSGNTTKNDLWYFSVEAFDGEAYSGVFTLASNVTILNSIPVVSEGTATFNNTSPDTSQSFNITYQFSDSDGDEENQSRIIVCWFVDSGGGFVYRSEYQNYTIIFSDNTSSGEIWYYKLQVCDGESYSNNATSILGVGIGGSTNIAPWAVNLTLTPISPDTTQPLIANYSYTDADNDLEVAMEIRWYKNNLLQPDYNNLLTIPSSETEKGQNWNFTVKVFDGTEWSQLNISIVITISNSVPEASNLGLNSGAYTDDDLIATWQAFDEDSSDVLSYNITWYQNGVKNQSWNTSDLNALLDKSNTSKNTNWTYTIRVFDGIVYSVTESLGYNLTINNSPPFAENLTITSNPKSIDTLGSGWDYYDIDGDSQDSFSAIISWFKNGENQTALFNKIIIEAGNLSKNHVWWFKVQVSDGENHSVQIYESAHVVILNTEPIVSGSQLPVPTDPTRESGITLNLNDILLAFNDPDLDIVELKELKWYKDNILQIDLTGSLLVDGALLSKGETWNYSVIVTDSLANSTILYSQEIQIVNSQPIITNTYYAESDVWTLNDLEIEYQASDIDNDPLSIAGVNWYRFNSSDFSWDYEAIYDDLMTLPFSATAKGDRWRFEIQVTDGNLLSEWRTSAFDVEIKNSIPEIQVSSISITGGDNTSHSLTLDYYWFDDDPNDTEGLTEVVWESSTQYITNESMNLPSKYTTAGERWWITIRPHDGEEFGEYYNSKQFGIAVIIGNTPPEVIANETAINGDLNGTLFIGTMFGTMIDLVLKYNATDIDGDQGAIAYDIVLIEGDYVSGANYKWYRNRTGVIMLVDTLNGKTTVPFYYTHRGDIWWCEIKPRDLYGDFGIPINSTKVIIGNTEPVIQSISWINEFPTTNDSISFIINYFDADNDPMVESETLIYWFSNGVIISGTENQIVLSSSYFTKNDNITVVIRPFDGLNWAAANFTSNILRIQNSPPQIINIILKPLVYNGTEVLYLNWSYYDTDRDLESSNWSIVWNRNGVNELAFTNEHYIPLIYVRNGDLWRVDLRVNDGTEYSAVYVNQIITKVLTLNYEFEALAQVYPEVRTNEFYVEDENISISCNFETNGDADNSLIQWFRISINGTTEEQDVYENKTLIPFWVTSVGETWFCTITPFDGFNCWKKINSTPIIIQSRPSIETSPGNIVEALNDLEGHYIFNITVGDSENVISFAEYTLNDTLGIIRSALRTSSNNIWILDYQIPIDQLESYLGSFIIGEVRVGYTVTFSGQSFDVYEVLIFNFTIMDSAAPRVISAYFIPTETNITFYANVEEFGSGIQSVECYYYFEAINQTEDSIGIGSSQNQMIYSTSMESLNTTEAFFLFSTTIPFEQNETDWRVIYWIETSDNAGNTNPRAWDLLVDDPESLTRDIIYYNPPGLPDWVIYVGGLAIFLIFVGAVVYVRFIRKPELVGLDKELVMKGIQQFTDAEILGRIEHHTIGGVISYFDQQHGPVPIVIHPEILKDNYSKLVDLSDRSFSSTGFSSDFTAETTSSYDYVLHGDLIVAVMSFGFALEKPEARGGKENITFNLLIYQDLFNLLNQFLDEIKINVHKLHLLMIDKETIKDQLMDEILLIRKQVSRIILSYESLYGTTELLEEEDE